LSRIVTAGGARVGAGEASRWGSGLGVGAFRSGAGGAQAVAVVAGLEDVGVEGEPVDDRGGQAGVGEGLAPYGERGVCGDGDGRTFLSFGDDLEQQFGAAGSRCR